MDKKIVQLKEAAKAKEAKLNKELMACRQRTVALQTSLESQEKHIAILYCALGVMFIMAIFVACRGMGGVESHGESEEWDSKL